jgi:thiol-disulfide isomerase/thioredoxin
LAIPPLVLVFAGSENQGLAPGRNGFEQALFSLVCMALLISALAFIELRKQLQKLEAALKRIEFLESIANDGRPIEFDDAGHPSDALPIGAEFPDFAIQNLDSRIVTFEHLLADFRPKLFFFVGPRCEPCKGLIPFFKDWKAKLEDKVRFVFISSGSKDENKNRFSDLATDDILIEEDRQLAKKVYAKWTPTALFVRADGKISSHPAVGDVAIKDFVEKIAKENFSSEGFYIANGSSEMSRIKIGSEVPEFELVSIDGKRITRDNFLGHETIALFLSVTCAYCQQVKDRLRVIEKEIANPKFIIFSDGEVEDYRGIELETPIILDKGYSVATKLGMLGAPSAVLINENGVIVSETAIGTNAIWSLLGKYD